MGSNTHHINNSYDFVQKIQNIKLKDNEKIVSFDVSALFTSIPTKDAIKVIRTNLEQDPSLKERTPLNIDQILQLLELCLDTTYFTFRETFYKQTHGATMGSPVSPIVASLYMEAFEVRAIDTAPHPPVVWYRYVDDTFVVIDQDHIENFHHHIHSIDENIKFTIEPEEEGHMPFLDVSVKVEADRSLSTKVYRKKDTYGPIPEFPVKS